MLAGAVVAGYALIYPERMPSPISDWVEDLTGANAHPITLMRPPVAPLSAIAVLGREMFNDPSLSASGKQSCASCHSAAHSFGPPNDLAVQLGGPHMTDAGYRPVPSIAYLYRQAPFSIGPDQGDTDAAPVSLDVLASAAQGVQRAQKNAGVAPVAPAMVPQGGFFWDGRASTLQDQALGPMTNPVEMANPSLASVADKLVHSKYIGTFSNCLVRASLTTRSCLYRKPCSRSGVTNSKIRRSISSRANTMHGSKDAPASRKPNCEACACSTTKTKRTAQVAT